MDDSNIKITATLLGIRPIMFDRFAGTNVKLDPRDKVYSQNGECGVPILNVYSLLSAQNTPSVAKRFYGKQGRDLAMAIQAHVNITAPDSADELFAVLRDKEGKVWRIDDPRIKIRPDVARLPKGIPNEKERPFLPRDWQIKLQFEIEQTPRLSPEVLRQMVEKGGMIGLGTFRPIFGRYHTGWTD